MGVDVRSKFSARDSGFDHVDEDLFNALEGLVDVCEFGLAEEGVEFANQDGFLVRMLEIGVETRVKESPQLLDRRAAGGGSALVSGYQILAVPSDELVNDVVLGLEVVIQASGEEPHAVGDVADGRRANPLLGEERARRLGDLDASILELRRAAIGRC